MTASVFVKTRNRFVWKRLQDTSNFFFCGQYTEICCCTFRYCVIVFSENWEWQQHVIVAAVKKPNTAVWKYLQCKLKPHSRFFVSSGIFVILFEYLKIWHQLIIQREKGWICDTFVKHTIITRWVAGEGDLLTVAGNLADVSVRVGNNIFWEGLGEVGCWRGMFCHIVDL